MGKFSGILSQLTEIKNEKALLYDESSISLYEIERKLMNNIFFVKISSHEKGIILFLKVNDNEKYLQISDDIIVPIHFGLVGVSINVINMKHQGNNCSLDLTIDAVFGTGFFSKNINLITKHIERNDEPKMLNSPPLFPVEKHDWQKELLSMKFLSLINLIKADGKIEKEEINFFEAAIDIAFTDDKMKLELIQTLNSSEIISVDYSVFKENEAASMDLILTLLELAKRDNHVPLAEKIFIKDVAKKIGYSEEDINIMLLN